MFLVELCIVSESKSPACFWEVVDKCNLVTTLVQPVQAEGRKPTYSGSLTNFLMYRAVSSAHCTSWASANSEFTVVTIKKIDFKGTGSQVLVNGPLLRSLHFIIKLLRIVCAKISVADPELTSRIQDPGSDFFHPGSRIQGIFNPKTSTKFSKI